MLNKIDAVAILLLSSLNVVLGIRFVIDREECFSHYAQYEGDTIHASFVVISNTDAAWQLTQEGVDLVVSFVNEFHIFLCVKVFFLKKYITYVIALIFQIESVSDVKHVLMSNIYTTPTYLIILNHLNFFKIITSV